MRTLWILSLTGTLSGCFLAGGGDDPETLPEPDTDTDADADSDSDTDTDADSDADSDSDTDVPRAEDCTNGLDDDGDGDSDCFDPDCAADLACCPVELLAGVGTVNDNVLGLGSLTDPSCGGVGGPEITFAFTPQASGIYRLETLGSDFDTVLTVLDSCAGAELACDDDSLGLQSRVELPLTGGVTYVVSVDARSRATPLLSGDVALTVTPVLPEACGDGVDNDLDLEIDCFDTDCLADPACLETCGDGLDNDLDGDPDCFDVDCVGHPACGPEACGDNVDNDADGDTDCADFDCATSPSCVVEICNDGGDNDFDGVADCADFDCLGDPACGAEVCDDGYDNDGDGFADCLDRSSCGTDPACCPGTALFGPGSVLGSVSPNRNVNDASCDAAIATGPDASFAFTPVVSGPYAFVVDADFDHAVSVRDSCGGAELACDFGPETGVSSVVVNLVANTPYVVHVDAFSDLTPLQSGLFQLDIQPFVPVEICDDNLDNDLDTLFDCDDPECTTDPACVVPEVCDDSVDNDGDSAVDCVDPDCASDPACLLGEVCDDGQDNDSDGAFDCFDRDCVADAACCPVEIAGTLPYVTAGDLATSSNLNDASCALGPSGNDHTVEFTAPAAGTYQFTTGGSYSDVALALQDSCGGAELDCDSTFYAATLFRPMLAGETVLVLVDGFDDSTFSNGPWQLTIAPVAPSQSCPAQITTGPGTYFGNTVGQPDDNTPTCVIGYSAAGDTTVEFTAPSAGTYTFDTFGTVFDTILSVLDSCGGASLACNDDAPTGYTLQSEVSVTLAAGQTVIVVVDGYEFESGPVTLNIQ
ncbi:MAG: hypothetical protein AAF602_03760 [Myxococcota bacterium]